MTDSPLHREALRQRSIEKLTSGNMLDDDDVLNYMLGLIYKDAAEQTAAGSSQQWACLNSWLMEKLYP